MVALLSYLNISNETIQTRTGARQLLDAPILASVSHERKNRTLKSLMKRSNKQVQVFAPTTSFAYVEQINSICTHLEHEASTRQSKLFLITGVGENEGKSTVSSNVAAALALKGYKVALLDCDLRNPSIHRFFGNIYNGTLPLNKLLALPYSTENLKQCMVLHEQTNLYMLLTVHPDLRSTELLSGPTMTPLLEQLRVFDFVIVDSPPMGMFPDSEILADIVDASMLVVRQDYTAACDINDAIDTLNSCNCNFLGCVLNDMRISLRSQYGYGSKYGKGSKYSHAGKYVYGNKSHDADS
jgi:capsular exopolysaccharide synthesis family protein